MARDIRIGIVGGGVVADAHAAAILRHAGASVAGVYDADPGKAREASERWGVWGAPSLDSLLSIDDLDGVTVATPPFAHIDPAIAALRRGLAVLCEKPLARSLDEAGQIVEVSRMTGAPLACASARLRTSRAHETAVALIEAGRIGTVLHAHLAMSLVRNRPGHQVLPASGWFLDRNRSGGGALMDIGVYLIDSALSFLGYSPVTSVTAQCWTMDDHPRSLSVTEPVEDSATVFIRCESGSVATIDVAWVSNMAPMTSIQVSGSKGGLRLDPLTLITGPNAAGGDSLVEVPLLTDPDDGYLGSGNLERITEDWLSRLEGGLPMRSSATEALEVMRVIDAAYQSAKDGKSIQLRD